MINMKPKHIANFWQKVKKMPSGCWEWQGCQHPSGYGRVTINRKTYRAHRVSYYLYNGTLSENLYICHSCDNPKCVNPSHLWEGTAQQNVEDLYNKKRDAASRKKHINATSKYKGVSYRKENNTWKCVYTVNYKNYTVGTFKTELEAALAYDEAIRKYNKENLEKPKPLNFP